MACYDEHYCDVNMMTSSNANVFRVTGHLCGEFTGPGKFPAQRPVTRSFDVFFDLHPNKWLSKQWWGWWFDMPQCPLRRHSNVRCYAYVGLVILWKLASWSEVTLDWWCLWYAYFDSELSKLWTCLHGQAILKETIRHVTLVAITGTAITVPYFKLTQVTTNYFKIEHP